MEFGFLFLQNSVRNIMCDYFFNKLFEETHTECVENEMNE